MANIVMSTYSKAQGAHFVGSAPYSTAEETFTHLATSLPCRLNRMPDGEPGERNYWTWWLHRCFPDWALTPLSYTAMLAASRGESDPGPTHWYDKTVMPPDRKASEEITIKPTEYAAEAVASYNVFKSLKEAGIIERQVRFQVSIPSSCGIVCSHIKQQYRTEIDAAFQPYVLKAIREVQSAIPAEELSIQLDLAAEMGMLEYEQGRSPEAWFGWFQKGTTMPELVQRTMKYFEVVKEPVELGLHFCYGDIAHEHWAQPLDTRLIVSLYNEIKKNAPRSINFVHLPVPVNRDDEEYFKPLTEADLGSGTELYLGLVRENDLEGTERRLAAAQRVVKRPFGVATECGLGRIGDVALADDVLKISNTITDPV